jgi:uncharacterized membrane protein YdjX (TVP38/TMEM64 family)
MLALIGGYIVAIAMMIPTSLFIFAMGLECHKLLGTFPGYFVGLILGTISTICGCSLAFLFSRYLLKSAILSYVTNDSYRARAILMALENDGFKLVTLFRLAPIFPFSLLNYALGASSVSFKNYLFGSIGFIPKLALYFYLAVSIGSISEAVNKQRDDQTQLIILLSVGAFFSVLAGIYVTVVARRELNRILDETQTTIIFENSSSNMEAPIL